MSDEERVERASAGSEDEVPSPPPGRVGGASDQTPDPVEASPEERSTLDEGSEISESEEEAVADPQSSDDPPREVVEEPAAEPKPAERRPPKKAPEPLEEPGSAQYTQRGGNIHQNIEQAIFNLTGGVGSATGKDDDRKDLREPERQFEKWTMEWVVEEADRLAAIKSLHELGGWSEILQKERVVGLWSASSEVVRATAKALVDREGWRDYRHLFLHPGCELGAAMLTRERFDTDKTILIVEADSSPMFVDSLSKLSGGSGQAGYARNLKAQKTAILVLFGSGSNSRSWSSSFKFRRWEIPFLRPLLESLRPAGQAEALQLALEEQRKAGHWGGDPDDDRSFYRQVRKLLYGREAGLLEAEVKERSTQEPGALVLLEADDFDYLCELFESSGSLQRAVLFAATFFPGLPPDDFDRVLRLLLGDEVTEVPVERTIRTKKGKEKTVSSTEMRRSCELWEERPDHYLSEAGLETVTSERGRESIAFESDGVRERLHTFIRKRHPMYLRRHFAAIREQALLFDPDISEDLVAQTVRLWAEMVEADRHRLGKNWLVEVAGSLPAGFRIAVPEGTDAAEVEQFAEAHRRELKSYHRLVFRRLADLIREMLDRPNLQDKVTESLNQLVLVRGEWGQLSALELVLGVTRRLRFAPEFDTVHWLKRVMDESRLKGQIAAYRVLLHDLEQAGARIYQVLEQVRAWLPSPDRPAHRFSPSNGFGLRLLLDYGLATALRHSAEKWGAWPSSYSLFADFAESESTNRQLELLVGWLFHDKQGVAVGDDGLAWVMRADLVELWWAILLGSNPAGDGGVRLDIGRALLAEILRKTGLEGQRQLIEQWRNNRRTYERRFETIEFDRTSERDDLWARRTLSVQLDREFNSQWKQRKEEKRALA